MKQIIPIIMILICVFGGAITLFFFKKSKSKNSDLESLEQKTANEFVNVKDIKDHIKL